jgi:nitrite transporter NirC
VKGATVGAFARNLLFVGLGNLVGGGLLVGAAYGYLGRRTRTTEAPSSGEANGLDEKLATTSA